MMLGFLVGRGLGDSFVGGGDGGGKGGEKGRQY